MVRPVELDSMRAEAERVLFGDEGRVVRKTQGAYSNTTFTHSETTLTIYEGPLDVNLVTLDKTDPRSIVSGLRTERVWKVDVPYVVQDAKEGDIVEITKARDEWMVRPFIVVEVQGGGIASRRTLVCREIT